MKRFSGDLVEAMMRREIVIGIFAVLVVLGIAGFYRSRAPKPVQEVSPVSPTNRAEIVQRAPSRPIQPLVAPEPVESLPRTNLLVLLIRGQTNLVVVPGQLQKYLVENHRNVESLLGAYRTTRDTNFLRDAAEKFPNDPRVNFDAVLFGPVEERRHWLEAFKQSAPDNALANYLSAADYFKTGQRELAIQELLAVGNKEYSDYSLEFLANAEEAYRGAGYANAEAQMAAGEGLLLPHLAQLKSVGLNLAELAKSYEQAGDTASAQAALQMAMRLGQRLDQPNSFTLIESLVGIAIQKSALDAMTASDPAVQNAVAALMQHKRALRDLNTQWSDIVNAARQQDNVPEEEVIAYFQRTKLFGAQAAMQWLVNKYGADDTQESSGAH